MLPSDDVTVTLKRGDLQFAAWALALSSGADQQRIARLFREAAQEPAPQRRGVPGREYAATVFLRGVNPA